MTLAQLQSFVLVARHGSVKGAAAELSVTEPAVSVAVSALRKELGDELFVRTGRGIALTPGGRRLAALAGEILALAAQAHRELKGSGPLSLRVLATHVVAEHIAPLIELFGAREDGLEIAVETGDGAAFAEALGAPTRRHRARPEPGGGPHRRGAVPALPPDPRRRAGPSARRAARDRPGGAGVRTLARRPARARPDHRRPDCSSPATASRPSSLATYSSGAAAIAAAAAGEGIALTPAHSVIDEVRRRALVRLDVRGTPVIEMWHASTLGLGRALPGRLGVPALRHHARGDPGDLVGPRRRGVRAGAAEGPRDFVAIRGRPPGLANCTSEGARLASPPAPRASRIFRKPDELDARVDSNVFRTNSTRPPGRCEVTSPPLLAAVRRPRRPSGCSAAHRIDRTIVV